MDRDDATRFRLQLMALHRRLRAEHLSGVALNELLVLGAVDRLGEDASPSAVAEDLKMARSNLSTLLRHLEDRGWISIRPGVGDGRRRVLVITSVGQTILARDRDERESWLCEVSERCLTSDERQVLLQAGELMQRLADSSPTPRD